METTTQLTQRRYNPNVTDVKSYTIDFSRMLFMQYQEIDMSIQRADVKAQLIMGVNAILIAAVTNTAGTLSMPDVAINAIITTDLSTLLTLLVFFFLLLSIIFALFTILPRFKPTNTDKTFFYFGDIIEMPEEQFVEEYTELSLEEVKHEILAQIHAKSFIVNRKFHTIRSSLICLFVAMLIWGILFGVSLSTA